MSTYIFGDGVGVVYAHDSLAHQHRPLLEAEGLGVVAHDVVEPGQQAAARCDLGVHGAVDVVEEVEGLADQLIAVAQQPLLDLVLPAREECVRIRGLEKDKILTVVPWYNKIFTVVS